MPINATLCLEGVIKFAQPEAPFDHNLAKQLMSFIICLGGIPLQEMVDYRSCHPLHTNAIMIYKRWIDRIGTRVPLDCVRPVMQDIVWTVTEKIVEHSNYTLNNSHNQRHMEEFLRKRLPQVIDMCSTEARRTGLLLGMLSLEVFLQQENRPPADPLEIYDDRTINAPLRRITQENIGELWARFAGEYVRNEQGEPLWAPCVSSEDIWAAKLEGGCFLDLSPIHMNIPEIFRFLKIQIM